jgi:hypothetical protein
MISSAYPMAAYDLGLVPNGGNVEHTITNIAIDNRSVRVLPAGMREEGRGVK